MTRDATYRRLGTRIQLSEKNPPSDPLTQELERVAFAPADSGREALAKVTALRTLERLRRPGRDDDYPVDGEGRFHPGPAEMWELDRCDSDETRERWRRAWNR